MYHDALKKLTLRGGRRAGAGRKRLPEELKRQRRAMRKQITISWNVSREWEDKKSAFGIDKDKEFLQYILKQARPVEEEDKENPLGGLRNLVTHFNDLRRENKLCDAVLQVRTQEGVNLSFSVHKLVLTVTSRYFKSLSREELKSKCEFFLQDVTPKGLGLLLDYMYGLKIDPAVHYSCMEEVVNAATVLQVDCYLKMARGIVKRGRKISEMTQMMAQQADRPMDLSLDLNPRDMKSAAPSPPVERPMTQEQNGLPNHVSAVPGAVFPQPVNITCSTASLLNQSGGQCTTPTANQVLPQNAQPLYLMMPGVNGVQNLVLPTAGLPQYQLPVGFVPGVQAAPAELPKEEQSATGSEPVKSEQIELPKTQIDKTNSGDFGKNDIEVGRYLNGSPENSFQRRKGNKQRSGKVADDSQPIDLSKVKSEPPDDCYFGYKTPPLNWNDMSLGNGLHQSYGRQISSESVVSPSAARAAASVVDDKAELRGPFIYGCDVCKETFQFKSFLVRHEKKTHKFHYKSFLTSKRRFLKFLQRDAKTRRFSCKTCFRKFSQENDLKSHLQTIHKYKRTRRKSKARGSGHGSAYRLDHLVTCTFCKQDFITKKALRKHIKDAHLTKSKRSKCDKCSRSFASAESLQRHRTYKHKVRAAPKEPPAEVHGSMFYPNRDTPPFKSDQYPTSVFSALPFGRPNNPTKPAKAQWICHLCSLVYNQRSLLVKHLQIIHNIESPNVPLGPTGESSRPNDTFKPRWVCHVCNLYFGHRWSLLRHLQLMHSINQPRVQPVYGRNQEPPPETSQDRPNAPESPKRDRPVPILPRPYVPEVPEEPPTQHRRHRERRRSHGTNPNASDCKVCTSMASTAPTQDSVLETRANIQAPAYSQMTFKLIKSKNQDANGKNDYTLKLWPRKEMVSYGNKWSVYRCSQCQMPFRRIQCFTKHMTKEHGMPFAMAQVDMEAANAQRAYREKTRAERRSSNYQYNFKVFVPPEESGVDHVKFRKT